MTHLGALVPSLCKLLLVPGGALKCCELTCSCGNRNANPATLKNFTTDSSTTRGLCVSKISFFFFLPEDKLGLGKLCPKAKIQLAGQS